jgi:hypothetical protein
MSSAKDSLTKKKKFKKQILTSVTKMENQISNTDSYTESIIQERITSLLSKHMTETSLRVMISLERLKLTLNR